jgi:DNA-binding MarR family transcriptional regulator
LADRERVTAPSMNRTVSLLEEAGYVSRIPDETDRRRVTIDLTDLGRRIVDETVRRRDAFVEEALAELSPEERQVLARATTIMRKVADR